MFDSFDIDTEDYSDVLAHDDDCKIQAKNIVEQANCQVMKNRAAQAIKDRHSGRRSTFDIIKNWANRAVIDLDSIKPGYESLEADNLICVRAEDKDVYSKNNSVGFYGRLDYKGTKDPIVRHVLLENERELVWAFCYPSTIEYAKKLPTYVIAIKDQMEKKVYEWLLQNT